MAMAGISLTSGMRSSLLSLQSIAQNTNRTQERLSTGRKVNSALDNPTNFFASQASLNRASDLLGRKDSVKDAIQNVAAANRGITAISSLLATATGLATAALDTTDQTARNAYSIQFDQVLSQIDSTASDSGYNGTNLLKGDSLTVNFAEVSGHSTLTIAGVDATSLGLGVDKANSAGGTTNTSTITTTVSSNVALGGSDPVVINGDGSVTAVSNYGGVPQPSGLTGVVSVASGTGFTLALQSDGTVVGWGDNTYGQVTIPSGLTGVTAVSAGNDFSLALKSDGTVVGWGNNTSGQTTIPSGLTGVVAISAGYDFGLALKSDGSVVGWGDNTYGQTNTSGLTGVTAISAGNDFGLALMGGGTVVGWGDNSYGQTNTSGLTGVTAISAGENFALALSSGTVVGWGDNSLGQTTIPSLGNVVAVSAGIYSGLALDDQGNAVTWGFSFTPIPNLSGVKTTASTISIAIPNNSWSTTSGIQTSLDQLKSATDTMRSNSKQLAGNGNILTTRLDFISTMANTLQTGADNLTLADMNEEGANMLMLQTRQSLAINSLSLGAQSAQSVLRLF